MTTHDKKQAPLHTMRDGAISIKLWEQNYEGKSFVNATIGRTYQDKETGTYGESRSFGDVDLLKLHAMLPEARAELKRQQEYLREAEYGRETPKQRRDLAAERDAVMSAAREPNNQRTQDHTRAARKEYER